MKNSREKKGRLRNQVKVLVIVERQRGRKNPYKEVDDRVRENDRERENIL